MSGLMFTHLKLWVLLDMYIANGIVRGTYLLKRKEDKLLMNGKYQVINNKCV